MNEIASYNKQEFMNNSAISTIVFISDLHFDYICGKKNVKQSKKTKNSFVKHIKKHYMHSVICILGDCYDDYSKTLSFIQELEKEKIMGFFVLGNHDFWNDGTKNYAELIHIFEENTKDFKYFRLLTTGRKYYIGNLCFIGDTGWTSFQCSGKRVKLSQFMRLPEGTLVKDFLPKQIISMHNRWIRFANEVLEQENEVIMLTHFPMVNFAEKAEDCWWSSETKLIDSENCWKIFGHTHNPKQQSENNVSTQRGYWNRDNNQLEIYGFRYGIQQYREKDFGVLIKVNDVSEVPMINLEPLIAFFSSTVIRNPNMEIEMVAEIKRRGFRRCSANSEIFAELAERPKEYLGKIKRIMNGYTRASYMGYKYMNGLSEKTIYAIHTAIVSLEQIFNMNDFSNPHVFVLSAIITGYVYNYMPEEIDNMRPIDYYDVVRFYLVFQTMKRYNLSFEDVTSIRKHSCRTVRVANLDVCLPSVNRHCLTVEEAYACIKETMLLSQRDVIE